MEKFKINPEISKDGYTAKSDGKTISVTRVRKAEVTSTSGQVENQLIAASMGSIDGKECSQGYLEGLTDLQIYELTHAKVILLTAEQKEKYASLFSSIPQDITDKQKAAEKATAEAPVQSTVAETVSKAEFEAFKSTVAETVSKAVAEAVKNLPVARAPVVPPVDANLNSGTVDANKDAPKDKPKK